MTPAARVAAAIEILDEIFAGEVAEKALSGWGRSHRFAGSKDRAAIRDHVFQALRCKTSYAWLGGAETGRGVMLGAMREAGTVDDMFSGEGYGPDAVTTDEIGAPLDTADRATRLDTPTWMLPLFDAGLGAQTDDILGLARHRAGVFLRVNTARGTITELQERLTADQIATTPVDNVKTALQVIENERRIAQSNAYIDGLIELQDPSSQAAVLALPIGQNTRVLDFCAGGGGKALAMAAMGAQVTAHDIEPRRTKDIEPRATRAGCSINIALTEDLAKLGTFDLVFCDAPCSGSGTWRRAPEAKWQLTSERLAELVQMQSDVLNDASAYVGSGGHLVYATCSVFAEENSTQIKAFLDKNTDYSIVSQVDITPSTQSDGFHYTVLIRS